MSALAPVKDPWLINAVNLFTHVYTRPTINVVFFSLLAGSLSNTFPKESDSLEALASRINTVLTELKSEEARRTESITKLVQSTLFQEMNVASEYSKKAPEVVKSKIVNLFRKIPIRLPPIFDNPVAMDWLCRAWETKHPSPSSQQ